MHVPVTVDEEPFARCDKDKRYNFYDIFKKLDSGKQTENDNIDSNTWFNYYQSLNENKHSETSEKVAIEMLEPVSNKMLITTLWTITLALMKLKVTFLN